MTCLSLSVPLSLLMIGNPENPQLHGPFGLWRGGIFCTACGRSYVISIARRRT